MRRLLPDPADEVDLYDVYRADAPAQLLRLNMVLSADGRVQDRDGRTAGLGGEGDHAVFRTLRALADAILVGAGTVRTEGYGPHRLRADLAERRRDDGRPLPAPIVVVSRSLELDFQAPLFREAQCPTVVLTCEAAPEEGRTTAARVGALVIAGEERVDLGLGLSLLREQMGLRHVLCEGGPTLNTPLLDAGLVDELCLTLSPAIVGEPGTGLLEGETRATVGLQLRSVLEQDGELFLRYGTAG